MNCNVNTLGASPTAADDGWLASLDLQICQRGEKSVVSRSRQTGPLTIQSPFYPENGVCHLYLLHPPAGIVGGDRLRLTVSAEENCSALVTTPGATKFYKTNGNPAHQEQVFSVADGATFEWLPQETIYFPDTNAQLTTSVQLEGSAKYLGWEINCLGLPANQKGFGFGRARIKLFVIRGGTPVLSESLHISNDKRPFQAAFLQNQSVFATFIATGGTPELLDILRDRMTRKEYGLWAATLVEDVIIIRYLGGSTIQARKLFVASWKVLRPLVLGKEAVLPRIWAT